MNDAPLPDLRKLDFQAVARLVAPRRPLRKRKTLVGGLGWAEPVWLLFWGGGPYWISF